MKLLQLRLENFRQHQCSEVTFTDGMTAIVGANGSGKTTLLEALTFALYGEQRDTLDTVKFLWSEGRKFSVSLRFAFDGRIYEALRSNSEAYLKDVTTPPGLVLATGKEEMKRSCIQLLGLNYRQFKNSFCAEQKEIEFMKFERGADLQQEIGRMLGFDRLRLAEALARERKKEITSQIEGRRATLELSAHAEIERAQAQKDLQQADIDLQDQRKFLSEVNAKIPEAILSKERADTYRNASTQMEHLRGIAEGLKTAAARSEQAFVEAQKDAEEKRLLEAAELEFQALEKERAVLEKQREDERQREALELQRRSLADQLATADHQIAQLPKPDVTGAQQALETAAKAQDAAKAKLAELESQARKRQTDAQEAWTRAKTRHEHLLQDLKKAEAMIAKGVCPECGQTISETTKESAARRRKECEEAEAAAEAFGKSALETAKKSSEVSNAEAAAEAAEGAYRSATEAAHLTLRQADALKAAVDRRDDLAKRLTEVENGIKVLPSQFDAKRHGAIVQRLTDLNASHTRFMQLALADQRISDALAERTKANAALADAKRQFADLKEQRSATGFATSEDAEAAIASFNRLEADRRVHEAGIQNAERNRAAAERSLKQAEQRLALRKEQELQLKELEAKGSLHNVVAAEMKALREELNKSIKPDLIARASENLSLLTSNRYSSLELNRNYEPVLIDEGQEKKVISGGEEDVVALSLRLALSERIQELNGRPMSLLILDEVFGSLDADRRQNVLDRLLSLKGRFAQIIVISHIEDIHQIADHCIYLKRDDLSRSTIVADTVPEQIALEF